MNSSGKIVVINNNNTNINIHHQSPYAGNSKAVLDTNNIQN